MASNSDQKAKPLEERTTQLKTPRTVYLLFRISTGCRQFDKVRFPSHSEIDVAVVLHSETSHHRWLHLHWINELSIDHSHPPLVVLPTSMTLHVLFGVPPWYFLPLLFLPSKKNPQSFDFFRRHFDTHLEPLISLIFKSSQSSSFPLLIDTFDTNHSQVQTQPEHQYHHGQHIETQILQRG